jgi:hypothetical protein
MEFAAQRAARDSFDRGRHADLGDWVSPAYKTKQYFKKEMQTRSPSGSQEYYTDNRHRNLELDRV